MDEKTKILKLNQKLEYKVRKKRNTMSIEDRMKNKKIEEEAEALNEPEEETKIPY